MTRLSTRRDMIRLSPTASSGIPPLFREWWRLMIEITPRSDAECNALVERAGPIREAIFALPTVTAEDLAMKVLVHLGNGDFLPDEEFLETEVRPLAHVATGEDAPKRE